MKVPLLEYLDKLEVRANLDITYCDNPETCAHHHEVPVQLALIAKLREAVALVRQATVIVARPVRAFVSWKDDPAGVINRFQDDVVAWAEIEVINRFQDDVVAWAEIEVPE